MDVKPCTRSCTRVRAASAALSTLAVRFWSAASPCWIRSAQHPEREQTALATLLLEDDLGERHGGEVFAALVLE